MSTFSFEKSSVIEDTSWQKSAALSKQTVHSRKHATSLPSGSPTTEQWPGQATLPSGSPGTVQWPCQATLPSGSPGTVHWPCQATLPSGSPGTVHWPCQATLPSGSPGTVHWPCQATLSQRCRCFFACSHTVACQQTTLGFCGLWLSFK